jgi:hydroxyethylthiazole kinase-like uncharacterized protein yjeF
MTNYQNVLYRAEQVRAMDSYTITQLGISGTVLMERAGAAAFNILQKRWPQAKTIAVVCGTGNNGGDGFVMARLAAESGLDVRVLLVGNINHLQGDALAASQRLQSVDIDPVPFDDALLTHCDLIIDAILGIGLRGPVEGERYQIIETINQTGLPVLALDIPSGLNANSGEVQGIAIRASATVCFIGLKRGLYAGRAQDYCGEIVGEDLNVPETVFAREKIEASLIHYADYKQLLRPRARTAHKGHFGHVLVVGGEAGFTGAVRMAGEAAARVGAGLVSIGTRAIHAAVLNTSRPELMVHALEDQETFLRLAERANVIAIGPGLGQGEWGKSMLDYAIQTGLPLVVDADALNLVSQSPQHYDKWILTPHCGEAARLLGQSTSEIQRDRYAVATSLQQSYGGIAILKGAGTLVVADELPVAVCSGGNPGMASGGMGDVLTGIISGLLAQGFSHHDAACLGVCLHAAAGDAAAKAAGERGLLATDLMSWIRRLANP